MTQVRERLHTLHGARASVALQAAPGGGTVATLHMPAAPRVMRTMAALIGGPMSQTPTLSRRRALARAGTLGLALGWPALQAQDRPHPQTPLPAIGSRLVLPEVALLSGGRFTPALADGQVLVLYWWASWCPFCALQSPHMEQLWRTQSARGLAFLGLSIDKTAAPATAYLRQKGYTFPSGWVSPEVARVLPKPQGLPVTVVRGRDGQVVMAEAGQLFPEDVAEIARFL